MQKAFPSKIDPTSHTLLINPLIGAFSPARQRLYLLELIRDFEFYLYRQFCSVVVW
jgi:hypothetical protein